MARRLLLFVGLLALAAGCVPQARPAEPPASELRVGIGALPKNPDPNSDSSLLATPVYRLVYDSLLYVDEGGATVPWLFESWRVIEPTVWEFKVRDGVTFHNGEPFDANAAKFNIDRTRDPETKSVWAARLAPIRNVEVIDSRTLRIVTARPLGDPAGQPCHRLCRPQGVFHRQGPGGFVASPVGSGPYRVKEWRADDLVVLEANTVYWRGRPGVPRVIFRMLPDDGSRVASLEAGELDVVYAVPPEQVERLRLKNFNVRVKPVGHAMTVTLRSTEGGPLADRRVRQALNYAVDKDLIIRQLVAGLAPPLDGQLVGRDGFGYNPGLKAYPYDPRRARQLLAEAGYPEGFPVKFHCSQGRYLKDKEICEAVAGQLAQVGVRAEMEILESGVWWDLFTQGKIGPMFLIAWLYAPSMDLEFATVHFTCGSPRRVLCNPAYDELFNRQSAAVDPSERLGLLQRLSELLFAEAPVIFLFQVPGIYAVGPNVKAIDFRADYSFDPLKVTVR